MKRVSWLTVALAAILIGTGNPVDVWGEGESLSDYSFLPPFLGANVKPNILMIIDRSSSMLEPAYNQDSNTYVPAKGYEGYFERQKCYLYSSDPTGDLFSDPRPKSPGCVNLSDGNLRWDGNFLNWLTMRRFDVAKWALTGGQCIAATNRGGHAGTASGRKGDGSCPIYQGYVFSDLYARKHKLDGVAPSKYSGAVQTLYVDNGTFYFGTQSIGRGRGRTTRGDTYNIRVVAGERSQIGVIQRVGNKARMGIMITNGGGGGLIGGDLKGNKGVYIDDYANNGTELVTSIDELEIKGGTPLYESMYDAARYFAQVGPPRVGIFNQGYYDPYCFYGLPAQQLSNGAHNGCSVDRQDTGGFKDNGTMGQYVPCCKSFVLLFSDGEQSTTNEVLPESIKDLAHVAADHQLNNHHSNSGSKHYLDDVSYWAHITDLRPETGGIAYLSTLRSDMTRQGLPGMQNLTIFTFHAFGDTGGKQLLQAAAKVGGFEDSDGNNLPNLGPEWDKLNNTTRENVPDGIPDNYFQADNATLIQSTLQTVLDEILQKSAAGTAVSVLASSSSGEGAIYQSYFYPGKPSPLGEANWVGYFQSLFLDDKGEFREDTDGDAALTLSKDMIMETFFDTNQQITKGVRWTVDVNGNKIASSTIDLKDIKPIWEAGKLLADRPESTRKILTWIDNGDGYVDAAEVIHFNSGQSGTLLKYLRATTNTHSENIINFIRGRKIAAPGFRNRDVDVGVTWKLGDILYSDPALVGPPVAAFHKKYNDASYAKFFLQYQGRRRVVYVGANDGMLHAFNAGFFNQGDNKATGNKTERGYFTTQPLTGRSVREMLLGEEIWGFIPQELLPHLQWLTTDDYDGGHHVSFVDGSPRIAEVQIFDPDTTHPNGWGTILIGSMRMGGGKILADLNKNGKDTDPGEDRFRSAYFALDITDPEQDPKLLWVFKDNELGFTTSHPTVARLSKDKWFVVFGAGPTTYKGERNNSESKFGPTNTYAQVYMIDLKKIMNKDSGFLTRRDIDVNDLNAFMGDPGSFDVERDYVSDVIYMGKTFGSFGSWKGKMYRILTRNNTDPGQWNITTLLNPERPVLTRPTVSLDSKMRPWVYFGTGRLFTSGPDSDTADKSAQALYGIKEGGSNGCWDTVDKKWKAFCSGPPHPVTNLFNSNTPSIREGGYVNGDTLKTVFSLVDTDIESKDGWVLNLANGERILQNVAVLAGVVLVPSYTPKEGLNQDPAKSDTCNTQGNSSLYGLYFQTGTAFASARQPKGVFYTPADSTGSTPPPDINKEVKKSVDMGLGIASEVSFVANTTNGPCDVTGISQSSTGAVQRTCLDLGIDPSGIQIFREGKN
jgi:type IV pilus assembly protein PilY1